MQFNIMAIKGYGFILPRFRHFLAFKIAGIGDHHITLARITHSNGQKTLVTHSGAMFMKQSTDVDHTPFSTPN